jgi:hypothetical protein
VSDVGAAPYIGCRAGLLLRTKHLCLINTTKTSLPWHRILKLARMHVTAGITICKLKRASGVVTIKRNVCNCVCCTHIIACLVGEKRAGPSQPGAVPAGMTTNARKKQRGSRHGAAVVPDATDTDFYQDLNSAAGRASVFDVDGGDDVFPSAAGQTMPTHPGGSSYFGSDSDVVGRKLASIAGLHQAWGTCSTGGMGDVCVILPRPRCGGWGRRWV